MTLLEAIDAHGARLQSAGVCFGHGTTNAFDEAAWLVLWSLGRPLDAALDDPRALSDDEQRRVADLVERRIATRLPAAYLTREAWLQGVPFYVDERAIVPRSLVAEPLVDGTLDAWLPAPPARVLDLCTGNGSLAVLAALAWVDARVDAADLSRDALDVARINVERHGLAARIELLQGDGLAAVAGRRYDVVLCNPPYVNARSMAALPAEFRAEPSLALAGGSDGMDFVRPLLRDVASVLHDDGVLVLEIGHERAHFERAFPRVEAAWLPTSAGDDQVLLLGRGAIERLRKVG